MLVFFLGLTFAKNACVSGSAECVANTLRVCGIKNQWIYVDCPTGTECAVKGNEIACVPRTNKGESEARDKTKSKKKDESSNSLDPEEKQDSKDDQDEDNKDNKKPEEDRFDEDDEGERKKNHGKMENGEIGEKRSPKNEIGKSKRQSLGEKNESKERKENKKKEPKTVTKTISTSRKDSTTTVTVTKIVIQKQQPTEIKLEYTSSDIESKVKPIGSLPPSQSQAPQDPGKGASISNHSASPSTQGGTGGGNSPGKSTSNSSSPPSSIPPGPVGSSGNQSSPASSSLAGTKPTSTPSLPSNPSSTQKSADQGKPQGSGGMTNKSGKTSQKPSSGAGGGNSSGKQDGGGNGPTSPQGGAQAGKDSGASEGKKPPGSSSGSSKPSSGTGDSKGGGVSISSDQLTQAMTKLGYSPKPEYIDAIVSRVNEKFNDMNEAAMFIAQCAHESGGYQYIEEIACAGGTGCAGQYGSGAPGKSYHGRGFIQLSWPDNYKAAGEALGLGDELYNNPEKVAEDPNLGADVSIYYWESKVANAPGVKENHFGATTKAINGALECTGSNVDKSKKRYEIYTALVEAFGISNPADESGCYS
ncbi:endochitinase [Encephalitozoon romaleae SJ-2008]|uniref:Endochitinase n=1 Tax=Encephalitozoon romaleae (strain SJ-2008) TaxID=1178016 RepID=I7ATD2_ENCRO|nr:endochitinase [Encephalitozoon romaleae SJ-2008]AFN83687.1 endochitinase [Encephalitozoon romaleae SJ-2008]